MEVEEDRLAVCDQSVAKKRRSMSAKEDRSAVSDRWLAKKDNVGREGSIGHLRSMACKKKKAGQRKRLRSMACKKKEGRSIGRKKKKVDVG